VHVFSHIFSNVLESEELIICVTLAIAYLNVGLIECGNTYRTP